MHIKIDFCSFLKFSFSLCLFRFFFSENCSKTITNTKMHIYRLNYGLNYSLKFIQKSCRKTSSFYQLFQFFIFHKNRIRVRTITKIKKIPNWSKLFRVIRLSIYSILFLFTEYFLLTYKNILCQIELRIILTSEIFLKFSVFLVVIKKSFK